MFLAQAFHISEPGALGLSFGQASLTVSGGYPIPSRNTRREGTAAFWEKKGKIPQKGKARQWQLLLL